MQGVPAVAVVNKTDLEPKVDMEALRRAFSQVVSISARNGEGLEALEEACAQVLETASLNPAEGMLYTERQRGRCSPGFRLHGRGHCLHGSRDDAGCCDGFCGRGSFCPAGAYRRAGYGGSGRFGVCPVLRGKVTFHIGNFDRIPEGGGFPSPGIFKLAARGF